MGFNNVIAPTEEPLFDSDGILSPIWREYFTRLIGVYQFKTIEDKLNALVETVIVLNEDTENAEAILTEWAADGVLSSIEKAAMNAGFIERCVEYVITLTKATAFGISTIAFTEAFENWGTYLNNGSAWAAPTSTVIVDDDIPSWINSTGQVTSTAIVPETFVEYAVLYFVTLTAVKTAIEEYITTNLIGVVDIIDGWAVDGKFSPIEKSAMNVGWIERSTEYINTLAQATDRGLSTVAYTAAFVAWGTYLNDGVSWTPPTEVPIIDDDMPSWIQEANLETTTDIVRANFVAYAADYLSALTTIKIAIAEDINSDITAALSILDDWASDEWFSPAEKVSFAMGWVTRSEEFLTLKTQATALGLTTELGVFTTAFETWGTYINGGTAWAAPTDLPIVDDDMPLWIKAVNTGTSTAIVRATFVSAGTAYFEALNVMKVAVNENINSDIANALEVLDDWSSDSIFSPIEKAAFADGWVERSTEFLDIKARAAELSISTTAFIAAFEVWGTYLNNSVAWSAPTTTPIVDADMPTWIKAVNLETATDIVRADFISAAATYFTALKAIKDSIGGQVVSDIETAQTTANVKARSFYQDSIPTSVSIGDIWFDTDNGNTQYRAAIIGADQITAGEWELAQDANVSAAINILNGWAVDSNFAPLEKAAMNAGWINRSEEFISVRNQATSLSISTTAFVAAFDAWGTYLNNGSAWTPPTVVGDIIDANMPSWIKQANLTTSTAITRSTFVSTAETYFTALATIKASITTTLNSNTSTAATTATWSSVAGTGKPEDYADKTQTIIQNGLITTGQLSSSDEEVVLDLTNSVFYFDGYGGDCYIDPYSESILGLTFTGMKLVAGDSYLRIAEYATNGYIKLATSEGALVFSDYLGYVELSNDGDVQLDAGDDVIITAADRLTITAPSGMFLNGTEITAGSSYTHPSYATTDINTADTEVIDLLYTNSTGHITTMTKRYLPLHNSSVTGVVHPSYRVYCAGVTSSGTNSSKFHDITPNSSGGAGQVGSSSYYYYWSYTGTVYYKTLATFDFVDDLEVIRKMSFKKDVSGQALLNPDGSFQAETSSYHDSLTNRHEIFKDIRKNRERHLTEVSTECVLKLDRKFKEEELEERNALIAVLEGHQSELDELDEIAITKVAVDYSTEEYHEAIADDNDVPVTTRYSVSVDEIKDMEFMSLGANIEMSMGGVRQIDEVVNNITLELGEWLADHEARLKITEKENAEQKILLETQASKITELETQLVSVLKRLGALEV